MAKRLLCALILLLSMGASARALPLRPFYTYTHDVRTSAQFAQRLESPQFHVDRRAFVALYNREVGDRIGHHVADFEALTQFLRTDPDLSVGKCDWTSNDSALRVFGVSSSGKNFQTLARGCHPGEYVLRYRSRVIFSLYCGNLIRDERKVPHAENPQAPQFVRSSTYQVESCGLWSVLGDCGGEGHLVSSYVYQIEPTFRPMRDANQ